MSAFGLAVLHSLWWGTLVAALYALSTAFVERPATRHALGLIGLGATLFGFVATAVAALPAEPAAPLVLGAMAPEAPAHSWTWWLGVLWLGLAALMLLRLSGGAWLTRRWVLRASPAPEAWLGTLAGLAPRLGLARPVRLAVSRAVTTPVAVGIFRAAILLPPALLTRLPPRELEALLAHELAHIRRHDFLWNLVQMLAEALLFFHPAVWWLGRQIREERELAADDLAATALGEPLLLAHALARLETLRTEHATPAARPWAPAAHGGSLYRRVRRLVGRGRGRGGRARVMVGAGAVLLAAVTAWLALKPASPEPTLGIQWLPERVERWAPQIEAAADAHRVDPALLAVMVLVESEGDPTARSPRGSLGLMQVMPETAGEIAKQRGLPVPTADQLLEPGLNLDFGAWYLAQLLANHPAAEQRPTLAVELAAIGYNAGPRRLVEYLRGQRALSEETTRYRQRVSALWIERNATRSPTYEAWRGDRADAAASADEHHQRGDQGAR